MDEVKNPGPLLKKEVEELKIWLIHVGEAQGLFRSQPTVVMVQETLCSLNVIQPVARQEFRAGYYLHHSPSKPFFHALGQRYQKGLTTKVRHDVRQRDLLSDKMDDAETLPVEAGGFHLLKCYAPPERHRGELAQVITKTAVALRVGQKQSTLW